MHSAFWLLLLIIEWYNLDLQDTFLRLLLLWVITAPANVLIKECYKYSFLFKHTLMVHKPKRKTAYCTITVLVSIVCALK
jgi:hypothetical protein